MRAVSSFALAGLVLGLGPGCTTLLPPWDGGAPVDGSTRLDVPTDTAPACAPSGMDCPPGYRCTELGGLLRCVPERDGGPDAPDTPEDAPPIDVGPPDAGPMLPPATTAAGAAADFGCLGTATAPTAGVPVATTIRLRGVVGGGNAVSTTFWMFPSNVLGATCSAPACTMLTTDTLGRAPSTFDGAWFAYRVPATMSWLESVGVNATFGASGAGGGGTPLINTMSPTTQDMLHAAYGVMRQSRTGAVYGTLRDCNGLLVRGVVARLSARGAELVPGPSGDAFVGYFATATTPAPAGTYTEAEGGFYAGNLDPVAPAVVEAWGVLAAGMPIVRLACEELPLVSDGVSFVGLRPLRGDYPMGHPCR